MLSTMPPSTQDRQVIQTTARFETFKKKLTGSEYHEVIAAILTAACCIQEQTTALQQMRMAQKQAEKSS
jgi:hypothetical protein